jgi:iron-sulfur cluster assembly protein
MNTGTITLTTTAADHVREFLHKRGRGIGLRLGVKTSGCSGLAYKLEVVDNVNADDIEFDCLGVRVFVDSKSLCYLNGTTLDYVKQGVQQGFCYINPNVKAECGCGESFTV